MKILTEIVSKGFQVCNKKTRNYMRHISDACQVNFSLLNSVQAGIILKVISYYLLPAIDRY